jgi:hypothetical protein
VGKRHVACRDARRCDGCEELLSRTEQTSERHLLRQIRQGVSRDLLITPLDRSSCMHHKTGTNDVGLRELGSHFSRDIEAASHLLAVPDIRVLLEEKLDCRAAVTFEIEPSRNRKRFFRRLNGFVD